MILSVELHGIETVRVLTRISKEFANHGATYFLPELILLLVQKLHLLLFPDLLKLGPITIILI